MRTRGVVVAALALILSQFAAPAAWAGPASDAHTDPTGIDTHVSNDDNGGGAPNLPGQAERKDTTPMRCELSELDPDNIAMSDRLAENGWGPPRGEEPGRWMRRICYLQNGSGEVGDVIWVHTPTAVDPAVLAREARDRLPLPAPMIEMSPPSDRPQVVNGPSTWLSIDAAMWKSLSSTVSVPGVAVTARADPLRVTWDMGTGDAPIVCNGPGQEYDGSASSECSYVWRRPSTGEPGGRFTVTVTVEWRATWSVVGAAGGGTLGNVSRTSTVAVEVTERRAVNTKATH